MKWFRNLFKDEENITNVYEEVKKKMEQEEQEEKKEQETFDVEVIGKLDFDIEKRKEESHYWDYDYYVILFKYDVVAKFLDNDTRFKGEFYIFKNYQKANIHSIHSNFFEELEAYIYLGELLKEGDEIMENIQYELTKQIKEHLKNNRAEELKKILKENNALDINTSFKIEKPSFLEK